jgi:hypothetical protein
VRPFDRLLDPFSKLPVASNAPIILLGTHRSGTTWLGQMLRRQPDIAFIHEPRHIWTWRHSFRPDDVLDETDATPRIVRHIHSEFDKLVRAQGKDRLGEKTPSNCLRVRFVQAVYPLAHLVLIVRDGRSVITSTQRILRKGVATERIWRRAKRTPLSEWPAQAPQAISTFARRVLGKPLRYWGPRPPGWKQWLRDREPEPVILAKQWVGTLLRAHRDALSLGPERCLIIRYEELLRDPRRILSHVAEFTQLKHGDQFIADTLESMDPSLAEKWKESIDAATLELIRPHMEPALNELGYEW